MPHNWDVGIVLAAYSSACLVGGQERRLRIPTIAVSKFEGTTPEEKVTQVAMRICMFAGHKVKSFNPAVVERRLPSANKITREVA